MSPLVLILALTGGLAVLAVGAGVLGSQSNPVDGRAETFARPFVFQVPSNSQIVVDAKSPDLHVLSAQPAGFQGISIWSVGDVLTDNCNWKLDNPTTSRAPGVDGLLAYLRSVPRLQVEDLGTLTVDGRPAHRVDLSVEAGDTRCDDDGSLILWRAAGPGARRRQCLRGRNAGARAGPRAADVARRGRGDHRDRDLERRPADLRRVVRDGVARRRLDPLPQLARGSRQSGATVTTSEDAIRIVLADDAVLLREALAAALEASGFHVVGQAEDVPGLLALVAGERPDVAIVDVRMPPTHTTEGLEAARHIRRTQPEVAILVLSQYIETRYAIDLIREDPAGIGYLLKERVTRLDDLADAVRRVAAGGSVIDPEVVARLLGRPRSHSPLDELTPREREILALMAEGRRMPRSRSGSRSSSRPSRATSGRSSRSSDSSPRARTIDGCSPCSPGCGTPDRLPPRESADVHRLVACQPCASYRSLRGCANCRWCSSAPPHQDKQDNDRDADGVEDRDRHRDQRVGCKGENHHEEHRSDVAYRSGRLRSHA